MATKDFTQGDVVAIPAGYVAEFRRDAVDALLKYGSTPQRSRAPWFTDVAKIDEALRLPDQIVGEKSDRPTLELDYRALVGAPDTETMLGGISDTFRGDGRTYWHCHVDLALNKKREGDAAGIAMGRITEDYEEKMKDPNQRSYNRIVRAFEVPLVAQIIAPVDGAINLSSIVRFVLQLKQLRNFNITSFSFDGFQSADASQQLVLAGLVTAGMDFDPETGEVVGIPKPFSVDRTPMPYRDLLEGVNEERVALPMYKLLRKEMRELETKKPGQAPDHPKTGTKDALDAVAGVVGYLAAFGHTELIMPDRIIVDRTDIENTFDVPEAGDFTVVTGDHDGQFGLDFSDGLGEESGQFSIDFNVVE